MRALDALTPVGASAEAPAEAAAATKASIEQSQSSAVQAAQAAREGAWDAWVILRKEDFDATGTNYEDAEGIINYARSIKDVLVAVSFTEVNDNKVKVSFRSKKDAIDVNKIAFFFKGGGHKRASGAQISGTVEEVKEKVLKAIYEYLAKSNN